MDNSQDSIEILTGKLNILLKRQEVFQRDIEQLRNEIQKLKSRQEVKVEGIQSEGNIINEAPVPLKKTAEAEDKSVKIKQNINKQVVKPLESLRKTNFEKFIGENLFNKIGIIVTIIGISIGAKYAIDHQLINPLTRIILGYLAGIILMGFSFYLRKKYENYSAVLLSGSMAVMYFITYAAYSFYNLIPQTAAFILMVVFTAFTVYAALSYDKQVIAHIGLVAAYAVPFLLSDGSGRVVILFSYVSIINIGILTIALKKAWNPLFYSAFSLTWLIYLSWYFAKYTYTLHFTLALLFLSIIFLTFYLTMILNNILLNGKYELKEMIFLLVNAFFFYGVGYLVIDAKPAATEFLGLFTIINAVIHFAAARVIKPRLLLEKKLFYMISGLVIVFLSLAVPVQLDGNWVTLIWVFLAATLFWLGRTKQIKLYESFGYALVFVGFLSLLHDWATTYQGYFSHGANTTTPFININFFSSVMVIAAFSLINIINGNEKYPSTLKVKGDFYNFLKFALPVILIAVIFFSIRLEISNIFNQKYAGSMINLEGEGSFYTHIYDHDITSFKEIWLAVYNFIFVISIALINSRIIKSDLLGKVSFVLTAFAVFVFIVTGLSAFHRLHESYFSQLLSEYYVRDAWNIYIRYFSYIFWGAAMYSCYRFSRYQTTSNDFKVAFDFIFYFSLLWILSNEVVLWVKQTDAAKAFKLGLSVLWGVYALFLIVMGIWRGKKYLRISAISLFGITLLKLFLYDTSNLDTIPKTIMFVSLGVLLLIISFLYNKYKWIIFNDDKS